MLVHTDSATLYTAVHYTLCTSTLVVHCVQSYLERMARMKIWLEMEIGITGGEEDGVDNSGVDATKLYTQPEQIWAVQKTLSSVADHFSIAAAFGNVHGVYKPGNVKLNPSILGTHQVSAMY
jgi:fructose-bisphosphate aldolase, class II